MNEEDRSNIESLKEQLHDFSTNHLTDFEYLKHLEENYGDVDKTASNLRQYLRIVNCYDFTKPPKCNDILNKYWPGGFIRTAASKSDSNEDYFINIETLGTTDGEGVQKSVPPGQFYLNRFWTAESMLSVMRKNEHDTGRRTHLVYIYDMADAPLNTASISMFTGSFYRVCKTMLQYYGSVCNKIIIINLPYLATAAYNTFWALMPEATRNKFVVLGSNWKEEIVQHIDPKILPEFYGGHLTDKNNDPKCSDTVVYTKKVPEDLYYTPSENDPELDELTELTVYASTVEFITVEIEEIGSILEWYYNSDGDWGFGVFHTDDEDNSDTAAMEMVYPQIEQIGGPSYVMEHDRIVCKKPGFYKLWFNNYFSWITTLTISHKINVIKPSDI